MTTAEGMPPFASGWMQKRQFQGLIGRVLPSTGNPADSARAAHPRPVFQKASEGVTKSSPQAATPNPSDAAIVSNTLDGIITSWDPAAERIFGHRAEYALGRNLAPIDPCGRF